MSGKRHFKAGQLINPFYVVKRIKTIRSPGDFFRRGRDAFLLAAKLVTGKYGKSHWRRKNRKLLMKKIENISRDSSKSKIPPFKVFWNWDINRDCNYNCSYCFYRGRRQEKGLILSPQEWHKVWKTIFQKYGECHIHIAGGEPCAYPDFGRLTVLLSELHTIEISTNLSFDIQKIITAVSPGRLKISSSFHPSQTEFEKFLNKAALLHNAGFNISVSYVGHPEQLDRAAECKEKLEYKGIPFIIQPFRGTYKGLEFPGSYSEKEKRQLADLSRTNLRVIKRSNHKKGGNAGHKMAEWHVDRRQNVSGKCRMGQMYGKIYPDGNVFRCCAHDSRKIGNILDPEFKLLDKPRSCESAECPCYKSMIEGLEEDWLPFWPS